MVISLISNKILEIYIVILLNLVQMSKAYLNLVVGPVFIDAEQEVGPIQLVRIRWIRVW